MSELFATRNMSERVLYILNSQDIKTINNFLTSDETAVFVRISNAGNLIFMNNEGEITYCLKDHRFLPPMKTQSLLSGTEVINLFKTLMLKKYPFITQFDIIEDDTIAIKPIAKYVNFTPFVIAPEGISKNAISHKVNTVQREIKNDFPNSAIHELNSLVSELLGKYKLTREIFSQIDDLAVRAFMSPAEWEILQVFLKKELVRGDLKKCKSTYQISGTSEVISPIDNPPLTRIVRHLKKCLKRFLNIQKNGKKYLETQRYLTAIGAEKAVLNNDYSITASFADLGTIKINPLKPYKRKTKAWIREEKAKIRAAQKETERRLIASPLFGRILPYEMLWLIDHSDHELTQTAICRIMRAQSGVSDWYHDAEEAFKAHCDHDILYSMITEADLKACLEALYDAHLLSSRPVRGEYTRFDVYSLTEEGKSFVSLMQAKGLHKGEYADLNRLIEQSDEQDIKSQLKAFSYLADHIPMIGARPSFMLRCVQSCEERALEYLDLQLALCDDENRKKSLRKIKKIIHEHLTDSRD